MIGVKAMTDEGKVVFRNNVFIAQACGFHVSGYRGGVWKKQEIGIVRSLAEEYLTFITATGESDVNAVYCDKRICNGDEIIS